MSFYQFNPSCFSGIPGISLRGARVSVYVACSSRVINVLDKLDFNSVPLAPATFVVSIRAAPTTQGGKQRAAVMVKSR